MATAPANSNKTAQDGKHAGAHIDRPDKLEREQYSISDLTTEFECTARALRFYEDEGLISPARVGLTRVCLLYTSPSPRDKRQSRMPSSA